MAAWTLCTFTGLPSLRSRSLRDLNSKLVESREQAAEGMFIFFYPLIGILVILGEALLNSSSTRNQVGICMILPSSECQVLSISAVEQAEF